MKLFSKTKKEIVGTFLLLLGLALSIPMTSVTFVYASTEEGDGDDGGGGENSSDEDSGDSGEAPFDEPSEPVEDEPAEEPPKDVPKEPEPPHSCIPEDTDCDGDIEPEFLGPTIDCNVEPLNPICNPNTPLPIEYSDLPPECEGLEPLECLGELLGIPPGEVHPDCGDRTPLECLEYILKQPPPDVQPPKKPLPPCYPPEPVSTAAVYESICKAPEDKPGENYQPKLSNDDDLDCGNPGIPENVKVIGEDVYNLDRDRDGIGCEDDEWGGNGGGGGSGTSGGGGEQGSGSGPVNMVPRPDQAVVKIIYEDEWSGSVSDGGFDSASYDGSGDSTIAFDCASGDIYSLTIQKSEDDDDPMILIVEDYSKQVLDQGQTSAEFGIVSLSGTC